MNKVINSWKKKLLDVGKRNMLMNYRSRTSSNLTFYVDDIYNFYDSFCDFKKYEIAKIFKNLDENISSSDITESYDEYDVVNTVTEANGKLIVKKDKYSKEEIDEFKKTFKGDKRKNYLFCETINSKANQVLTLLRRKSKLIREENGIESLYMCFFFVHYKDKQEYYDAPLALVPSKITSKRAFDTQLIEAIDDDFVVNENLCYFMRVNYKVDINRIKEESLKDYISRITKIFSQIKFEVKEQVSLGIFSFSKIMMYNDLDDHENLILKNPLVSKLCGLKSNLNENIDTAFIEEDANKQNQVLKADNSQYEAIYLAKKGLSFVLQGPPGTGKSQTITNMIAELIGQGKKVLFVCEKSSALEVVHQNLKKASLNEFALPIYDTKASKREIVANVYQNVKDGQKLTKLSDEGEKILDKVDEYKDFFDDYKSYLTEKRAPLDKSISDIICDSLIDVPLLNFNIDDILSISKDEYQKLLDNVDVLSLELKNLNYSPSSNPFNGYLTLSVSKTNLNLISKTCLELSSYLNKFICEINNINAYSFKPLNISEINNYLEILKYTDNPFDLKEIDFTRVKLKEKLKALKEIEKNYKFINEQKEYFLKKYKKEFLDLDVSLDLELLNTKYKHAISRMFEYKKIENKYNSYLINNYSLTYQELVLDLEKLSLLKEKYDSIPYLENDIYKDFKRFYFGSKTDFKNLSAIINYLISFNSAISNINNDYKSKIISEIVNHKVCANIDILNNLSKLIFEKIDILKKFFSFESLNISLNDLLIKIKNISLDYEQIYPYLDYLKSSNKINDKLKSFKDEIDNNEIDYSLLSKAFIKRYNSLLLEETLKKYNKYADLTSAYFMNNLNQYQKYCDKAIEVSKVKISSIIKNKYPRDRGLDTINSEVAALMIEAAKKKKLLSVRDFLSSVHHLLQTIKPIFMMSPLSVANYLDPNLYHFDTVIFDEASQITVENAVGSIYRADQTIVVGDKEQLPPTSFFDTDLDDEEDYDNVYESVLDACNTILPSIMLKWHYRSKDESLITYSNKEIYHDLTSFPAHFIDESMGLKYEYVENGVYTPNRRVNIEEAKRVVDLVFYCFRHYPSKSVGVVTFNMSQQDLILNLINQKRKKDSLYESFFDENPLEPFFIKNLETVQGDERDIIILSTTFGFDNTGKLSYNFGPINKDGGYRRLNVAITRAKDKLILVTSLHSQDLLDSKVKSRGLNMLKGFISYAESRLNNKFETGKPVNKFVSNLGKEFNKLGYDCVYNLGQNAYKIDLALVDKENPNNLIGAILTDSANYFNLKNSRDRNVLIDSVLKLRGWKIEHLNMLFDYKDISRACADCLKNFDNDKAVINLNVLEDVNLVAQKEEEILEVSSLFDSYPNILAVIDEEVHKSNDNVDKILNIILKMSPISISELIKLTSMPLFNTKDASDEINDIIKVLAHDGKIAKILGFALKTSDLFNLRFRKFDSLNSYNRTIDSIYIEELEAGFTTIISYVKTTTRSSLFKTFNTLLGYPKESVKTSTKFNRVLNVLKDKSVIELNGEVINYL